MPQKEKSGLSVTAPTVLSRSLALSAAAAEKDKESDYDDPNSVVIVEKVAEAVIHI
jgi:hypothetical protein